MSLAVNARPSAMATDSATDFARRGSAPNTYTLSVAPISSRRAHMDKLERATAAHTELLRLHLTEDFNAAVKAFINKKPRPKYKGK